MSAGPLPFQHLPTPVDALHIRTLTDVTAAYRWLQGHGVDVYRRIGQAHGALIIHGPDGTTMPVDVGQHLVLCLVTGGFAAWSDTHFRRLHGQRQADDLEAIMEALR